MSVLAMIVVAQWDEALLAAKPIDERPWIAHLVTRLDAAAAVTRRVVVCHPDCLAVVAPLVPGGVECVAAVDALGWAATQEAALVARVPVWQLFVDPARLDRLAATPCPPGTTVVRATLDGDPAVALTGGVDVDMFTALGARRAAAGEDIAAGVVAVPSWPAPPELRLNGPADAAWGRALQRAMVAAGQTGSPAAVDTVLAGAGLCRSEVWRDGAARPPQRVLTVRCQPAPLFDRLVAHLGRVPGVRLDVVASEALAEDTRRHPGVDHVFAFTGAAFETRALGPTTLAAIRARHYDLCVVPRRTACGRGFENVTPLGVASGAAVAVWMDVTGATGLLAGVPGGWDQWPGQTPPWREGDRLRARAQVALGRRTGSAIAVPETSTGDLVAALVGRMDEAVACHALIDVTDHGIDLAPAFVHQMPGVATAKTAVAHAASRSRPAAARLSALVDRALVAGVEHLAHAPAGAAAVLAAAAVRRHTDHVAALAGEAAAAAAGSLAEQQALAALAARVATLEGEAI